MKKLSMAVAVLSMAGASFGQGSLTPPGAPAPSMKTLDEIATAVEAVETRIDVATLSGNSTYQHIISQPGSYYLSGNLETTVSSGIAIYASGVTLDLNGFEISLSSGIVGGTGVLASSGHDRLTVRNGSVVGFHSGVNSYSGGLFEKLLVSECTSSGIYASSASRLVDCQVHDNSGDYGIYAGTGSSLSGCIANGNEVIYGIYAGSGSSLIGCTASDNVAQYGIYAYGAVLQGCTASGNEGNGTSSYGIYASSGSSVIGCTARYNSYVNATFNASQGVGFYVSSGSIIKDCMAVNNEGSGINVYGDCSVIGNNCKGNGYNGDGSGIHVISSGNRIEGNNVTDNDRGIAVDTHSNFITRNTAADNTLNWDVVAGNACLVVFRTYGVAVSGDAGGTAPGSTDPNANFSY